MLKLLKWAYNIGYKRAEDRYYYALMKTLNAQKRFDERLSVIPDDRQSVKAQDRRRGVIYELELLIKSVFHPQVNVETEQKDRFEP